MYANNNAVKVAVSSTPGGWGRRRIPHAKGGKGWCIRVPRGGVYVKIFGEAQELASCHFKLGYFYKPVFKVKLRNLEDGPPGRYCRPK